MLRSTYLLLRVVLHFPQKSGFHASELNLKLRRPHVDLSQRVNREGRQMGAFLLITVVRGLRMPWAKHVLQWMDYYGKASTSSPHTAPVPEKRRKKRKKKKVGMWLNRYLPVIHTRGEFQPSAQHTCSLCEHISPAQQGQDDKTFDTPGLLFLHQLISNTREHTPCPNATTHAVHATSGTMNGLIHFMTENSRRQERSSDGICPKQHGRIRMKTTCATTIFQSTTLIAVRLLTFFSRPGFQPRIRSPLHYHSRTGLQVRIRPSFDQS